MRPAAMFQGAAGPALPCPAAAFGGVAYTSALAHGVRYSSCAGSQRMHPTAPAQLQHQQRKEGNEMPRR